jgi:hypothetical protein
MMQPRENQLTLPGYWSHSEGSSDARGPEFHGTEWIVVSREGFHLLVPMLERVTAWNRLFRPGTTLIVKFE